MRDPSLPKVFDSTPLTNYEKVMLEMRTFADGHIEMDAQGELYVSYEDIRGNQSTLR